jgi:prepilin-type N-terminal cleavage/methylation domain-containing protein
MRQSGKRAGVAARLIFRFPRGRGQSGGLISDGVFFGARGGMTLIEVMIAMVIIAIVAIMCVSAFMTVIGSEMRGTNARLAMEEVETKIATGAEATAPPAAVDLTVGGFTLSAEIHTYSETVGSGGAIALERGQMDVSGSRSYSVLKGVDLPASP